MGFAGLSLYSVSLTTARGVSDHISLIQAHLCAAAEHSSATWNSF